MTDTLRDKLDLAHKLCPRYCLEGDARIAYAKAFNVRSIHKLAESPETLEELKAIATSSENEIHQRSTALNILQELFARNDQTTIIEANLELIQDRKLGYSALSFLSSRLPIYYPPSERRILSRIKEVFAGTEYAGAISKIVHDEKPNDWRVKEPAERLNRYVTETLQM